jgi:hypothetical protein
MNTPGASILDWRGIEPDIIAQAFYQLINSCPQSPNAITFDANMTGNLYYSRRSPIQRCKGDQALRGKTGSEYFLKKPFRPKNPP